MAEAQALEAGAQWREELEEVGFVRRLIRARRWYGADWWFTVISGALLIFIFSMAFFPGLYAPYDPRAEVGPGLLAPGVEPPSVVLVGPVGGVQELDDLIGPDARIGSVIGSQASQVMREAASVRQEQLRSQGQDVVLRPRPLRYDEMAEALEGLVQGEVPAVVGLYSEIEPLLDDYPELAVGATLSGTIQNSFALGTNQIGQDILSRVIWGTRIALIVAFSASVFALVLGVPLGMVAGFWSGRLERVLTLVMDSLYSFPGLILAIAIAAVLGPGIMNVIVAIATLYVPTYYRIVRGQTLSIKEAMYVEAARSLGAPPLSILWRYILPNVIPSLVVIFSVNVADAILTEAGLAFLGLGLPPDTPDWGIDLAAGQNYLRQAWWMVTFPGVMVTLVTLAFSMLGESLSEILNPRLAEL